MKFLWLTTYFSTLVWSALNPQDYFTWFLEAAPALIVLVILAATYKRFPLTPLAYTLILCHCLILFLGAHYTYAEVDTFKFIRDFFSWQRNNYDKLGHFAQGFVPAIIAREILVRHQVVNGQSWLNLFVVSICLAFSALYELFEWAGRRRGNGRFRRKFPRHPRLYVGHPIGYGDGASRCAAGASAFGKTTRSAVTSFVA